MMVAASAPIEMPESVLGLVETIKLVVEHDQALAEALSALAAAERLIDQLNSEPAVEVARNDIRAAVHRGDAARRRVRPLVRQLGGGW